MSTTLTAAGTAGFPSEPVAEQLFGHPKGLYVCFFTEMWERFSFYGMKALLLLYMIKHHRFTDTDGFAVLGAYGGMVYAMPVIGGLLADRWLGMRKAVVTGGILLVFGHLGMAYEGQAATVDAAGVVHRDGLALSAFYLSLSLIICGVGFLKPNISTIVGKLYPQNDPRRDSGFTLFYAGINLGALFSSLICGYLGEAYGWGYGFGAAGIGMVAGLAVFLSGQRHLMGHAEPPNAARLLDRVFGPLTIEGCIYLGTIATIALIWGLMQFPRAIAAAQGLMLVMWLGWLAWYVSARCNKVQRERMISIIFYIGFVLLFFALYEQTYGSWVIFTDRMLTKDLFPSMVIHDGKPWPYSIIPLFLSPIVVGFALNLSGYMSRAMLAVLTVFAFALIIRDSVVLPQTAGALTYLGALFIVLLAPLFAWLWPAMERRGINPSKPVKCAIGLALAGLSFLPLVAANTSVTATSLGSVWWLALAYLILEIGEVTISPITLSAIAQLTMTQVAAVMMSGWFLATSFSEQLAALFGSFASLDIKEGEQIDFAVAATKYGSLFNHMVVLGLASAVLALLCTPLLKRWMHGLK